MRALRQLGISAALVSGVLFADLVAAPVWVWMAAGLIGVAALAYSAAVHLRNRKPEPGELLPKLTSRVLASMLLGLFAVGAADMGLRVAALDAARLPSLDGRVVTLEGRVLSDPAPSGRATGFTIRAERIERGPADERVSVRAFGRLPKLRLGDEVRIETKIRRLDNNDRFDRALYRKRITARATGPASQIAVVSHSHNPLLVAANSLRERMNHLAVGTLGRDRAGLVLGLTIGDERLISSQVQDDFRTTSLSHLTAVSGANVAMVLGAAILLLRAFGASRRVQIVAGLATVGFFAVVTRGEPSVLRATVMASAALAAFFFGRRHDPIHGLALAFTGLVAFDPFMLWSIGFQLSFAAALGILLIAPRLLERLKRLPRPAAEALAVGLGAQIAVTPLLAFHFGRVSLVAIPANLAAFPLVAPVTVLGFAGGIFGVFWSPLARPLIQMAGPPAALLVDIAHLFASIPGSSISITDLGAARLGAAYLLIAAVVLWLWGSRRAARYPLTLAAVVWIFAALLPTAGSALPAGARAVFFDVGQGDAALIESAGGARVLIDGGPDPGVLARDLDRRGIRRIDLVVFSHAHYDHVNGLSAAIEKLDVRKIIEPGVPDPLVRRLLAGRQGDPIEEGDRFLIGDLTVDILGPSAPMVTIAVDEALAGGEKEGSSINNASLVIRIAYGQACLLFTGDVEEPAQEELIERHRPQLGCAVLKVPHHGSARISGAFVEAVDPQYAVVSVGSNSFGHPTRTALMLFERAGAKVMRTDRLGDVVLELQSDGRVEVP